MDVEKGQIISLDFVRRARAADAAAVRAVPESVSSMAFSAYELEQLKKAFALGKATGILDRFEVSGDEGMAFFRMFRPLTGLPTVCVTRAQEDRLTRYKCWTSYRDFQTVAEGLSFEPFIQAVRGAMHAMNAHYDLKHTMEL